MPKFNPQQLEAIQARGSNLLVSAAAGSGKTTVLKNIAAAITANNPDVHLMCLLVDERPEEVTDMERSIKGEVVSSTFDMPTENHIAVSELVIERAKRLVECGKDVVVLLDSLTRLVLGKNAMKNMEVLRLGGVGQLTAEGVDLGEGALSQLSELKCGAGRRGESVCRRCFPGCQGQGAGGKDCESVFVEEVACLLE